jgi:hypothetical protein
MRFVMVAYNLISLFRQITHQKQPQPKLSTLRFNCFAVGNWVEQEAQKNALRVTQNKFGERLAHTLYLICSADALRGVRTFCYCSFCLDAKRTKKIKAQKCFRPHANTPPRFWVEPPRSVT